MLKSLLSGAFYLRGPVIYWVIIGGGGPCVKVSMVSEGVGLKKMAATSMRKDHP